VAGRHKLTGQNTCLRQTTVFLYAKTHTFAANITTMAGNDSDKTFLKFLKEKCKWEYFNDIFKTFRQQCSWQKTYAWTVANAKFGLGIMLFFILKTELEALYVTHIAEQYLDITGWVINEWLVIVLALLIVVYGVIRAIFGAAISFKQARWTIAVLLVYWYYRDWDPLSCTFARMDAYPQRTFADLFALYGMVILGRWVLRLPIHVYREYQEYKNIKQGFHYDEPLKHDRKTGRIDAESDKLGRAGYAKQIADTIKQTRSKDAAFAMGITGSWGSGKTSFWRLIENQLRAERNIIIIEYRPWQNHGSGVIVRDFFAVLSKQLRPYDSSLSGAVDTYTKILLDTGDSTLTKIVKPIRALFCAESTAATEFARINDTLRRIDKQIVIFIDDLDRLDKNEVLDVIRLIRNTANFANIFFVAAYDRGYIMQALEDFNRYNKEAFLEKIFQLEVPLPKFEQHHLTSYLHKSLQEVLTKDDSEILKNMNLLHFKQIFHSIRDVNRFANLFIESYKPLQGNICFEDLLHVELLKYKFSGVYDIVFDGKMRFLTLQIDENPINDKRYYSLLTHIDFNENSETEVIDIQIHLLKHYSDCGISEVNIKLAIALLSEIFGNNPHKDFAVNYPSSFLRYSFSRLAESDLSAIEYSNARLSGYSSMKALITKWLDANCSGFEIENLLFNGEYDNIADFITVFKTQLHYTKCFYNQRSSIIDDNDFDNIIDYIDSVTQNEILNGNKNAVIPLFEKYLLLIKVPVHFKLEYIHLLRQSRNRFQSGNSVSVFSDDLFCKLRDAMMDKYLEQTEIVTVDVLNHIEKYYAKSYPRNFNKEKALTHLINILIPQNTDNFICASLTDNKIVHHPFVKNYFETFTNYKTYLESHDYTKTEIGKRYAPELADIIDRGDRELVRIDVKWICEGIKNKLNT